MGYEIDDIIAQIKRVSIFGFMISILAVIVLLIAGWFLPAHAENFLYVEQAKTINGAFLYRIPKVELNQAKWAGAFLGSKCYYLSEFEGSLNYTAPRDKMWHLNHHSIDAAWSLGIEISPLWVTYSIGGRYYIQGNDDGLPPGFELVNSARVGIAW